MLNIANYKGWLSYFLALLIIIVVYGAIPFYTLPTLIQSVWISGWAESFINNGWSSLHAVNFGIPNETPVAFGLSGVILQSFLIAAFDVHASDAYTLGVVLWLALALWGSLQLCQFLGASKIESSFLSLIYLTHPFIWVHAAYSMLSIGFAFLPLYIYMGFLIVYSLPETPRFSQKRFSMIFGFFIITLLSIFTDGYTFVMFFSACGLIWGVAFLRQDIRRKTLIMEVLPLFSASMLASYFLYTQYVGATEFPHDSLDFFRGWGVDLIMLFVPTTGISWLWDTLHLSVARSETLYFGDSSVWLTTFALPMLILGGLGYWLSKKHRFAFSLLLIALIGLYLSLGPSLKINSMRPVSMNGEYLVQGPMMPEELAVAPTGSAILYENLPGLKNMRATYRWAGFMFAGLYGFVVLYYLTLSSRGYKLFSFIVIALMVFSNFPDLSKRLQNAYTFKNTLYQIDAYFSDLADYVGTDSTVFFAPPGNDILVNYLAATGNYRTYNIGGDKNLFLARQNWPDTIKAIPIDQVDVCLHEKISAVLIQHDADFVVFPYFHTLYIRDDVLNDINYMENRKKEFSQTLEYFETSPGYTVKKDDLYTVVSLNPDVKTLPDENIIQFGGTDLLIAENCNLTQLFTPTNGWHKVESWGIWSSETASIVLNLPEECYLNNNQCRLRLTFQTFNASETTPKSVYVDINGIRVADWIVTTGGEEEWIIPLPSALLKRDNGGSDAIKIFIPDAESPYAIGLSSDSRILGVGLRKLELIEK